MANITNIKLRNDETVHPIALPFAVCDTAATISPKTLAFSGGDTPTALVNGQQIMVQFANGNTTACSISIGGKTPTVRLNNLSNGSIIPYIGAGAVVNLTYNAGNFYVSNAAALTGFEIPDTVTLATITNNGQLTKLTNNDTIGLTPDQSHTYGIENNSTIYNIVNNATIYHISNNNGKTIKEIANDGSITNISNTSHGTITVSNSYGATMTISNNNGNITVLNNDRNITVSSNHGTLTITNDCGNDGAKPRGTGILYITNTASGSVSSNHAARIAQLTNGGLVGRPDGTAVNSEGITNNATGWIRNIQNGGTIDLIGNSGTISSLVNNGTITTFTNTIGGIPQIEGNIGTFNLEYGSINTFNADSGITNFNIESHGFIDTLAIYQKVPGYSPAITTLNNGNRITTLNNNANGTISTLRNKGYISTLNSSDGRINNLSNLTAKIGINLPAGVIKEYPVGTVISGGIWQIDPGFSIISSTFIQVDNRDLGMKSTGTGAVRHYLGQSSADASRFIYGEAGSSNYLPMGEKGDPYYISPQGTGGSNCLLIIWENVSIGHDHGSSSHTDLTPGIYRIYFIKTVNYVYHYQIDKLTFNRL